MLTKTTTRTLNNSIRTAAFSKIAAARAQHTLPQLPYAYDVRFESQYIFLLDKQSAYSICALLGFGAQYFQGDYDLAPHQASPNLCQRPQRR